MRNKEKRNKQKRNKEKRNKEKRIKREERVYQREYFIYLSIYLSINFFLN